MRKSWTWTGSWSTQDLESRKDDLYPEILRDEAVARLNELGKVFLFVIMFFLLDIVLSESISLMLNVEISFSGLEA